MKVLVHEAQMPLPSSPAREEPVIRSKSFDEERTMAGWIGCLSRGRHDFDDEGSCIDCDAKRTT